VDTYEIPNFLTEEELLYVESFKDDPVTYIANNDKELKLSQVSLPDSIKEKIKPYGEIIKSEVYELTQPYRIHNDSRSEVDSRFTCILPLDPEPQGGVTVFHQWAKNFSYSLDPYYSSDYNKLLPLSERKIINEWDATLMLPDDDDFWHIRDVDKVGFTIAHRFEFEFNKLVVFPSCHFHCSNFVREFSSKSSLVMFTV
jgi:hypothetical protein